MFGTSHLMHSNRGAIASSLSNDQLRRAASSIFAEDPHDSRSERYQFIPTIQVINAMRAEGFVPVRAMQSKTRDLDRRDHTKHMVVLRHQNDLSKTDICPEIILLNSHDGSSSYQLHAGLFRFVCSNGIIVSDATFASVRVHHSGRNLIDDVIEGTYEVVKETPMLMGKIDLMQSTQLNDRERNIFAEAALELKYESADAAPIDSSKLLSYRRSEDKRPDLWATFNTVQENLIRGGLRGRTAKGNRTSTRAVKGVSENVRLNKGLWTLAEKMAQLKR